MKVQLLLRAVSVALSLVAAAPAAASTATPSLRPLHSFRMLLVDSTPQGSSSRKITFVAPDQLRVEIVGSPMIVVAIGKNVWLRQQNATWQKAEYAPGADPLTNVRATLDIARQLHGPQVRYIGSARLSGSDTKVYDVTPPKRPGYESPQTRIWIGTADGYPHQVQARNGAYVFTATYSAWNQALSVSAP